MKTFETLYYIDGPITLCFTFFFDKEKAHVRGRDNVYNFDFLTNGNLVLYECVNGSSIEREMSIGYMPDTLTGGMIFDSGDEFVIQLKEAILEYSIECEVLGGGTAKTTR